MMQAASNQHRKARLIVPETRRLLAPSSYLEIALARIQLFQVSNLKLPPFASRGRRRQFRGHDAHKVKLNDKDRLANITVCSHQIPKFQYR